MSFSQQISELGPPPEKLKSKKKKKKKKAFRFWAPLLRIPGHAPGSLATLLRFANHLMTIYYCRVIPPTPVSTLSLSDWDSVL